MLQARVIQGLAAFAASDLPTAGKVGDAALQQLLDAAGSPEREIQVSDLVLKVPDRCKLEQALKESVILQEAAVLCLEHLSDVPAHAVAILERMSLRVWVQLLRETGSAAVRNAVPGILQRVLFGGNAAEVDSNVHLPLTVPAVASAPDTWCLSRVRHLLEAVKLSFRSSMHFLSLLDDSRRWSEERMLQCRESSTVMSW